ncbi:hypothetical protein EW145_g3474 [Phellinidium pouzarii]|uniref:Uncharacterized protein n=1 Tax=Phellinidium pouzarii TaxID=167371 RepID=A0A4V3XCV4_9AGAM|nr:hypothetical protein EW145_g3474 [Phellinidium pouzarii]
MYSPHRLESPPPAPYFRRPWSPLELESYGHGAAQRQRREASDASFEALDLADYAMTLPQRDNIHTRYFSQDPQYPQYPATPPRSFSLASRNLYLFPPSLVSGGSSSSHLPSPRLNTPIHRPLSPRLPHSSVSADTGYAHNYSWIANDYTEEDEADLTTFPEWSKNWYKSQNPHHMNTSNSPLDPILSYDPAFISSPHGSLKCSSQPYFSTNGSHRNLLPWSAEDERLGVHITPEMKVERLRLLEREFGADNMKEGNWHDGTQVIGSVNANGNIVTVGPKKRIIIRWTQGTFALGAAIASLYSALLLKPIGKPPPKGTVAAYLLYFLSVITVLLIIYMFVFRPCCCAGKRKSKVAQEGLAGMVVLPVQGLPGAGKKKKKKSRKKGRNGDSGGGIQVNLIVDPSMFGGLENQNNWGDEEVNSSAPENPPVRRRGVFDGLAMEQQWKSARKPLKQLLVFDIALFFLWAAELVVILIGKRCPVGQFEGWCDGYNVATALTAFLSVTFGLSVFFGWINIVATTGQKPNLVHFALLVPVHDCRLSPHPSAELPATRTSRLRTRWLTLTLNMHLASREHSLYRTSNATQTGSATLVSHELDLSESSYTPTLPPELWLRVFAFLTYIPGVMSTTDDNAIEAFSEDSEGVILQELYRKTMDVKLAVSRVSWMWRILILPSLYEYVTVKSRQHARLVATTLSYLRTSQAEEDYYGRWVKRVEVSAEDDYWDEESLVSLVGILDCTPNIQVFSDFFSLSRSGIGTALIERLCALCEKGYLRRIEWSGVVDSSLSELLQGTRSLQVLVSRQLISNPTILPNLRNLIIRTVKPTCFSNLENFLAPNLRSLVMHSHTSVPSQLSATSTQGLFTGLQHLRWICSYGNGPTIDFKNFLGLTVLTLDLGSRRGDIERFKKLRIEHQTLERINIVHLPHLRLQFGCDGDVEERLLISEFMHSLLNVEENPSLKCIGLFIPRNYFSHALDTEPSSEEVSAVFEGFWRVFLAHCNTRGIKVEASLGSDAHFRGSWQPFHINLLPRSHI